MYREVVKNEIMTKNAVKNENLEVKIWRISQKMTKKKDIRKSSSTNSSPKNSGGINSRTRSLDNQFSPKISSNGWIFVEI